IAFCKGIIFLATLYFSLTRTERASEEIYVSIPFIKFKPNIQKKQDILLDHSILADSRLIDLAASGLLDNQILIPRFILKEIYELVESSQEVNKNRARRPLEVIKKLESLPSLEIRYVDTDFPEIHDSYAKIIRLARVLDASILTADMSQIDQSSAEGVRVINIHSIAKGLKPLTHNGEYINIKVQRYGKEARQGVGYLDDGTMVVINGGAEYIGESIKAQVLSVKHTSSGRMIFCNATEEGMLPSQQLEENLSKFENAPKSYFAL
ncbi:MAG TPA: TRAM domain-containing protein, partial [Waddliaceae bacterium]